MGRTLVTNTETIELDELKRKRQLARYLSIAVLPLYADQMRFLCELRHFGFYTTVSEERMLLDQLIASLLSKARQLSSATDPFETNLLNELREKGLIDP